MKSFQSGVVSEEYDDDLEQLGKRAQREKSMKSSVDDLSAAQRALREAIERQQVGLGGLRAARLQLLKQFARIERLGDKIDEAFAGEPFLPDEAADSPANQRRVNHYSALLRKQTRLLEQAIELWALVNGLKREDDWVPLLIAEVQQNTANALRALINGTDTDRKPSVVPISAAPRRHIS